MTKLVARKIAGNPQDWEFTGMMREPYRTATVAASTKGVVFNEEIAEEDVVGIIVGFANTYPQSGDEWHIKIDGALMEDAPIKRQVATLTQPRVYRPEDSIYPVIVDEINAAYNNKGSSQNPEILLEVALFRARTQEIARKYVAMRR